MESSTSITVSFAQNPAMQEALQGKQIGDACEVEMKSTIKELTTDGVVLQVEALVPDGYEVKPDGDENAAPPIAAATPADETIPTATASKIGKKI